jgi:hypothetical protein
MQVRQMSISYLPEQDRVLVRVNTSDNHELQFWFTRRLTLGLVPLFERIVTEHAARSGGPATTHLAAADPMAKKAIADFARAETVRKADFSTPYQTPATSQPVFASPLLITDISIAPLPDAQMRMICTEKFGGDQQARRFELALSQQLTHAFMHLLERAVAASQWRSLAGADAISNAESPVAPVAVKPDYLN